MRKETFKNADYPNRKAGNSSLHNSKLTLEDRAIQEGYTLVNFDPIKPIIFSNQKVFYDGKYYNVYEKL